MLHRLPSELLLDIIEHCDRCALKNLSLVFRRLRNPAQSLLYETLGLGLWTVYMGGTHSVSKRVKGILASPRLLSYIHSLRIYGKDFNNADLVDELFLSLNKMSSLKSISFKLLFRPSSLGSLCNLLSVQPLNICFEDCDYPQNYVVPVARLKILRLDWSRHPQTQGDFFDQLLERASQDISSLDTGMVTSPMRPVAMPQLTSLALSDSALSGDNLASFLKANPQLLDLTISEMQLEAQSLLTTVPRLQTINAPLRLLSHFVPGRPIKRVNVYRFSTSLQAVVEALDVLSQSTTPINDLRLVVLDYEIEDLPEIMKAVIRLVPRLEHLTIEFVADVSNPLHNLATVQPIARPYQPSWSTSLSSLYSVNSP